MMQGQPGVCTCHLQGVGHPALADLLSFTPGASGGACEWIFAHLAATKSDDLDAAACLVADYAMQWRCRGATSNYETWRDAANARVKLVGTDREVVAPFVDHAF